MSDFIFSRKKIDETIFRDSFSSIYKDIDVSVNVYNYQFGSFSISKNIYNGFNEYETDEGICVVIGGPVLNFTQNTFISTQDGNDGTKAIYQRWEIEKQMIWDEDLSGPFVICFFNKLNGTFQVITDMMSFIPVYSNMGSDNLIIGTHIDSLAMIEKFTIDKISALDFILHEIITFPYTIFNEVLQIHPATINVWCSNEAKSSHIHYWKPNEQNETIIYTESNIADRLRNALISYVKRITESGAKVGTFLSGGEDSRVVLSAIPGNYPKDSFIFIDELNRETSIAEKVAKRFNARLSVTIRKPAHYWDILESASSLIGSSGDYAHIHTYGFQQKCKFYEFDAILGGFLSDTLLKGHHIKKQLPNKFFRFLPIPDKILAKDKVINEVSHQFNAIHIEKLNQRRVQHLNFISELRPKSFKEWFNIWPISMHNDAPNIFGNRRLFRSFEPFTDSEIIKVSAQAFQGFKLNKKLFYKAFRPLFLKTKWIPHSSGSFPFLPWYLNNPLIASLSFSKRIVKQLAKKAKNQSSWSDWDKLMVMKEGKEKSDEYSSVIENNLKDIFIKDFDYDIIDNPRLTLVQKRMIIQLGYHISQLENKK